MLDAGLSGLLVCLHWFWALQDAINEQPIYQFGLVVLLHTKNFLFFLYAGAHPAPPLGPPLLVHHIVKKCF